MKMAVYCGSGLGNNPVYAEAARELGAWIADNNNDLIYGGGNSGIMGVIAETVHGKGREVIGVVPQNVDFIRGREQTAVTTLIKTSDMSSRKKYMLDNADVFFALPGGIGTLDEITEAITLTRIGVMNKPCIFFNRNDFYKPMKDMFDKVFEEGFFGSEPLDKVLFSDDFEEIGRFIERYSKQPERNVKN